MNSAVPYKNNIHIYSGKYEKNQTK